MTSELTEKSSHMIDDESNGDVIVEKHDYLFKIVLFGDSQSGKTSLLKRFFNNSFNDDELTTIGIDFKIRNLRVDEKDIMLQIWDTAGKKKFEPTSKLFLKGTQGVIFCFDLTSKESLKKIQNWVQKLEENFEVSTRSKILVKCLVGCKSDLVESREVFSDKGQKYAINMGAMYHEVSSKTGENVENVFSSMASSILANRLNWTPISFLRTKEVNTDEKSGEVEAHKKRQSFRTKSLRRSLSLKRSKSQKAARQRRYSDSELFASKKESKVAEKQSKRKKSCKIL